VKTSVIKLNRFDNSQTSVFFIPLSKFSGVPMLKKALFVTSAALAISTTASLPAFATGTCSPSDIAIGVPGCEQEPVKVPEPTTMLGILLVGGSMAAKKFADSLNKKP
jgi:hypothetical protein